MPEYIFNKKNTTFNLINCKKAAMHEIIIQNIININIIKTLIPLIEALDTKLE